MPISSARHSSLRCALAGLYETLLHARSSGQISCHHGLFALADNYSTPARKLLLFMRRKFSSALGTNASPLGVLRGASVPTHAGAGAWHLEPVRFAGDVTHEANRCNSGEGPHEVLSGVSMQVTGAGPHQRLSASATRATRLPSTRFFPVFGPSNEAGAASERAVVRAPKPSGIWLRCHHA